MRIHYLVFQQIFLIEEKDDGGVLEPGIGDNGPEKSFAFLHPILSEKNRVSRPYDGNRQGQRSGIGMGVG